MIAITPEWLTEREACSDQVAIYRETFGDAPVEITLERLDMAAKVLDLDWLACEILDAQAWNAYKAAMDPALAAYEDARDQALAAYEAAKAQALDAYEAAKAQALDACKAAKAQALWSALVEGR